MKENEKFKDSDITKILSKEELTCIFTVALHNYGLLEYSIMFYCGNEEISFVKNDVKQFSITINNDTSNFFTSLTGELSKLLSFHIERANKKTKEIYDHMMKLD